MAQYSPWPTGTKIRHKVSGERAKVLEWPAHASHPTCDMYIQNRRDRRKVFARADAWEAEPMADIIEVNIQDATPDASTFQVGDFVEDLNSGGHKTIAETFGDGTHRYDSGGYGDHLGARLISRPVHLPADKRVFIMDDVTAKMIAKFLRNEEVREFWLGVNAHPNDKENAVKHRTNAETLKQINETFEPDPTPALRAKALKERQDRGT